MEVTTSQQPVPTIEADALVIGIHEDANLAGAAAEVDKATDGQLAALVASEEVSAKTGKVTSWLSPPGLQVNHVVVVGLGKAEAVDTRAVSMAVGAASKLLAGKERKTVAFALGEDWSTAWVRRAVAAAVVACQGQDLYRREKSLFPFEQLTWLGAGEETEEAVEQGRILGEASNLTRRLVNEPAGVIYPETFAEAAREVAAATNLELEIWDKARLEAEKCGSLLAVAQGSDRDPRLVILRHRGNAADNPQLALVGKGVTFDSGGLSLKTSDGMKAMKCDMAGAATVLGAMQAIANLQTPTHVVGLVGLVENMVSGNSYKLGDVLTARSGKTIEVLNTDAEGRLVLADVLNVASEMQPDHMIDLATLTGACLVALGTHVAGAMTNDQAWCDQLLTAAQRCGERVWQLPMFAEFAEQIRSKVADIKNIGEGRWGGTITAAKFLEEFVEHRSWVHLDIAGPAFRDSPDSWIDAGGSGAMLLTLVELAHELGNPAE